MPIFRKDLLTKDLESVWSLLASYEGLMPPAFVQKLALMFIKLRLVKALGEIDKPYEVKWLFKWTEVIGRK